MVRKMLAVTSLICKGPGDWPPADRQMVSQRHTVTGAPA